MPIKSQKQKVHMQEAKMHQQTDGILGVDLPLSSYPPRANKNDFHLPSPLAPDMDDPTAMPTEKWGKTARMRVISWSHFKNASMVPLVGKFTCAGPVTPIPSTSAEKDHSPVWRTIVKKRTRGPSHGILS